MDEVTLAHACAQSGLDAGRAIRDAVHAMDLAERVEPVRSRLKPARNVRVDQAGEEIGIRHLEALSRATGHRIHLIANEAQRFEVIGTSAHAEAIWTYFDAIDGTIKVSGIGQAEGRVRTANDGGWASAMAFTRPTRQPFEQLRIGDFVTATLVDGNPPRHSTYPSELMTMMGADGLETVDVGTGDPRRVFTTSNEELATSMVYLDGYQAFDRASNHPGDEELAVELYRRFINRNEGGAYDVLRQYSNLSALQRTMLGWRDGPVWYEAQGAAFLAINENLTNLIPAVPIIIGAGGLAVDFDDQPLAERPLVRGRTSVVYAANAVIRARVVEIVRQSRRR